MGGQNNWRTGITGEDWMRGMEKRVLHEERRPQIRTASDILGPGIAPYCIRIEDWNAPETLFNGFWYSEPGAFNTPKSDRYWIGYSLAIEGGWGIERATEYFGNTTDVAWPRQVWVRKFWTDTPDALRQWSAWRIEDNVPPGIISEYGGSSVIATPYSTASDTTAWTTAAGWTITRQETRRVGTSMLWVDVEGTRTGAAIVRNASGDNSNVLVATLSTDYSLTHSQCGLTSGQQGRAAHFNCYASTRQCSLTSFGGTTDYAVGEDYSFGGPLPVLPLPSVPTAVVGTAPNGWMYCNGAVLNRASYPDLFGAIGTRFNTGGETATQFRIPSASGKVIKT